MINLSTTDQQNKDIKIDNVQDSNVELSPMKRKKIRKKGKITEAKLNTSNNECEDEKTKNFCNEKIENCSEPEAIFLKTEIIHSTPKAVNDNLNIENTNEIQNSSVKDKNVFSLSLVELRDLLKNPPTPRNRTESLQSSDVTSSGNLKKRKREISVNNDSEYFSDTFKSELYSSENYDDSEVINLLHDLDNVVHFEDTKTSSNMLLFPTDLNTTQETDNTNEDPLTDPLFISDHEKRDIDTSFIDLESKPLGQRIKSLQCHDKRIKINDIGYSAVNQNYKLNIKKKKVLKELENIKEQKELNIKEKKLLKELENIKEQEELPLDAIEKLKKLHVELVHKVPPQHKIELTGSHVPTQTEKQLFQRYGPLRKGLYSPTEDKIIKTNWKIFCKIHNWDSKNVKPFLTWRHNGKYYIHDVNERRKFVQFLANGLPWRTLYSVYSRFKVLYCNKITQIRYTSKEDKKILMYIENKSLDKRETKYTELAKLLRRTRRSIAQRYRYLKQIRDKSGEKSLMNVRWTLPLIKKFIKTLLGITLSDNIKELKYATLPKPIWQKMEQKLKIDENILKTFWQNQLHLQLFSTGPIYLNDIKIQLIEYMYGKGISNTREIIWPNVTQHFDGATAVFLCRTFFHLVQECNVDDAKNFSDIIQYLYHVKIPEIKEAMTDKFLPRITYKNGKIAVLYVEDSDNIVASNTTDDIDA